MSTASVLALIPARGGSKGIPRKNVRMLSGKPLIAHTIGQAREALSASRVVVSTEDPEIGAVSAQWGAEVVWRPATLSADTATSESALRHALMYLRDTEGYEPELVVFLQCTSPIRTSHDIDAAVQTLRDQEADSLLSVVPSYRFLWRQVNGRPEAVNYNYRQRPRRQDRAPEYVENGSIYVFKPWVLRDSNNRLGGRIAFYVMDFWSQFDIDDPEDFAVVEQMMVLRGVSRYQEG